MVLDPPGGRLAHIRVMTTLASGFVGGLTGGVVSRAWMRLVAKSPEFTWSGTLAITLGFAIFGLTQAGAFAAREHAIKPITITAARIVGAIGMLPLFLAAGLRCCRPSLAGGLPSHESTGAIGLEQLRLSLRSCRLFLSPERSSTILDGRHDPQPARSAWSRSTQPSFGPHVRHLPLIPTASVKVAKPSLLSRQWWQSRPPSRYSSGVSASRTRLALSYAYIVLNRFHRRQTLRPRKAFRHSQMLAPTKATASTRSLNHWRRSGFAIATHSRNTFPAGLNGSPTPSPMS